MMKYPKIVGWSVVIGFWSIIGVGLDQMKKNEQEKAREHYRMIQEVNNTSEDMIEWIEHDLESEKIDSSIAESYVENLEGIIINLGVTR